MFAEFSDQLYFELDFDAASGETDCTFSLNEPIRSEDPALSPAIPTGSSL